MSQLQRIAIAPSQFQQEQILLTKEQQHYLGRVLRLREGDRFIAMDGKGKWWLAQLAGEQAEVLEALLVETELPVSITLMVALPKGNGFDEVVRCCTELGVTCIAPVLSDRTLLHPSPQKLERWRRIAAEAAEQSERSFVPTILEPVAFNTGLSLVISHLSFANSQQYICEARGEFPHLKDCLQPKGQMTKDIDASAASRRVGQMTIVIATGPEGGWTTQEIENAIAVGFQPVSLGRRILRAVTAPVVALSLITASCEV
ncbi:MAG: 16S rRNA (uracil(1498)-N(3))-methyltransferase [Nostoc sp. DedVER02]|uniref:16S rRNA (uracil(1498)-N(3))-methyltransferase n=1 Tax=unclassified Nostoc TaxID=2593658 RepID=UPI002AD25F4F|nr:MULTISPECIES: 16S rRNA (uracil(1498)-N(3))-methyltransferase [unclassified Nostoc]MDZ7990186.1 16S rRNA (uracil(1498)-N(3))-methyltransferase [Nostoc sp. DedVER02]MDZ8111926.1 16S rRNA (uracil(1498)-N(3))-methyltransferase [Nostoc sp. DedVER01b]